MNRYPSKKTRASRSFEQAKVFWHRFTKYKGALVSLIIIVVMTTVAILAQYIAPYTGQNTNAGSPFSPPGPHNFFGTDEVGRDLYSLVLLGARISLSVGVASAVVSTVFGAVIGAIAGYYGGYLDDILMRFTELIMVIPTFILAVIFLAYFGPGIGNMVFIISAVVWPGAARTVRAEFMRLRQMEFVESARAVGAGSRHIIFGEILPNAFGVLIVNATVVVGFAIVLAAGLSFVGLGDPNLPDWGMLLNGAMGFFFRAWWMALFPGAAITITSLAFNILGDGLSQTLNPKNR
jgi:peptide/nickel transport system permease protein